MKGGSLEDLYKIKTIAALTGFTPTLLRAWERRYSLLEPRRAESGHRLYTSDDLLVLQKVRALLDQGRTIGEIVVHGRQSFLAAPAPLVEVPRAPGPELEGLCERVVQAALDLDEAAIEANLDRAFATVSVQQVVDGLLLPAACAVGRLWSEGQASVSVEHLLTSALERRLYRIIDALPRPAFPRFSALCACLPEEQHVLGALLVTRQLLRVNVATTFLGPCLPLEDLERACRQKRPQLVFLSVTRRQTLEHCRASLLQVVRSLRGPEFVIGGAGVSDLEALPGLHVWPAARPLSELEPARFGSSCRAEVPVERSA